MHATAVAQMKSMLAARIVVFGRFKDSVKMLSLPVYDAKRGQVITLPHENRPITIVV